MPANRSGGREHPEGRGAAWRGSRAFAKLSGRPGGDVSPPPPGRAAADANVLLDPKKQQSIPMSRREVSPSSAEPVDARPSAAPEPARARRAGSARRKSSGGRKGAGERRGTSAEKRKLILDTAIRVFAEKGYPDTRISDIAKRAEIAYGLVYHYFKNKEEILDTIFFERWGEFIEGVRAIAGDDGPVEDKLLSIAEVILSAQRSRPEWVKILIFEIQRSQRMLDRERMATVGELFETIAGILRQGQARGELRADLDPEVACYIFVGGLDTVVTSRVLALMPTDEVTPEAEGAHSMQLAKTVVELFVRGMAAPSQDGTTGSRATPSPAPATD